VKKIHRRLLLAFIFLALFQIACGCSVDQVVTVHYYEDLNRDGKQSSDEPNIVGLKNSNDPFTKISTDSSGNIVSSHRDYYCAGFQAPVIIPEGYETTERTETPPTWDYTPGISVLGSSACPSNFKYDSQTHLILVGLAPIQSKTAPPVAVEQPAASAAIEQPAPAPFPSILDGKVSYCVPSKDNYYINLPLKSDADLATVQTELNNGNLKVQAANATTSCTVDASNRLLTCAIPSKTTFPANVVVQHNGTEIQSFSYDGYCPAELQPNNDPIATEPPAATEPAVTEPPTATEPAVIEPPVATAPPESDY
jgi:hypothetical protein